MSENRPRPIIIELRIKRSLALHRAAVKRLKENPELWDVPLRNIDRWIEPDGSLSMAYVVWKEILQTWTHEAIN